MLGPGPRRDRGDMFNEISDLPPRVIGFEVAGKLVVEDYRDILLPAIEKAARSGEVRIVIVMPEFDGLTGGALWQDLKMGVEHWGAWKRIALVTDIEWMGALGAASKRKTFEWEEHTLHVQKLEVNRVQMFLTCAGRATKAAAVQSGFERILAA